MKTILLSAALLLVGLGTTLPEDNSFRSALIDLPPKYLGDIPLANRTTLIAKAGQRTNRLDTANGWLHWYSDGDEVGGTSMVWAKELPRTGKSPLVFVHMGKPFADGRKPATDQTFVLERIGKQWVDVTKAVIPATVDMTMHFRTRREDTVIEVAPWKELERKDGKGRAWIFGERVVDLRWTGREFVVEKASMKELTKN